jgi:hypothetical protein
MYTSYTLAILLYQIAVLFHDFSVGMLLQATTRQIATVVGIYLYATIDTSHYISDSHIKK